MKFIVFVIIFFFRNPCHFPYHSTSYSNDDLHNQMILILGIIRLNIAYEKSKTAHIIVIQSANFDLTTTKATICRFWTTYDKL